MVVSPLSFFSQIYNITKVLRTFVVRSYQYLAR